MMHLWTNRNAVGYTTNKWLDISHKVITNKTVVAPQGYVQGGTTAQDDAIVFSNDDMTAIREITYVLVNQTTTPTGTSKRFGWTITL
jgi:hypothetical protein